MGIDDKARIRSQQMKLQRPVSRQGLAISTRHMQILGALRQIRTVTAYTKQEKICQSAIDYITDVLSEVNDLVMDLELER